MTDSSDSSESARSSRVSPQILIFICGLLLWTLWPRTQFWSFLAAYAVAWLLLNIALYRTHRLVLPLSAWQATFVIALLLAVPLTQFVHTFDLFRRDEGLRGIQEHMTDRSKLASLPAVFPAVASHDRPQRFYIYAPDAKQVTLGLNTHISLPAQPLGHGLFRANYDPRRDGFPSDSAASVHIELNVDGQHIERPFAVVQHQAHPRWFASAPQQGLASTVSEETDELFILSRTGLKHHIQVGDAPTDTAFFDQGRRLAVTHRYSSALWIVDVHAGEALSQIPLSPFQVRVVTSPDETRLAVAIAGLRPGIQFLTLPSGHLEGFVPLDFPPDWTAFGPDANTLVISSAQTHALYTLTRSQETQAWTHGQPLQLGRPVVTLGRALDGKHIYLATTDYRPDGKEHRGNHFIQDQILTVDIHRWAVVSQFLTARRSERQTRAGSLNRGVSPMGIIVRQDGDLLIAFAGTDEVWQLEPDFQKPPPIIAGTDLDLIAPHGVADLGAGYWAVSSPAGGAMAVYDASNQMVAFEGVAPPDAELATGDTDSLSRLALRIRSGERAFYESTRAGLACQSCHLHSGTDYSPHDIGQRPLLHTLTVRGIAGTAPYLKDASFPRIRDLNDHLALTLYRGYERLVEERNILLESYVKSLPRDVNPMWFEESKPELGQAGLQVFVKAQCVRCHTFPAFTNLSQHPVRAVFPDYGETQLATSLLDTPSLLGIQSEPQLLQDGRAHDLQAVLDQHNPSNRHGDTAVLSDEEKKALIYFLKAL